MAGDWIKMRENLHEDPAVVEMGVRMNTRPEHVVGYCHRFWSWVSRNCADGTIVGVTPEAIECVLNLPAFLHLLVDVGWLETFEVNGKPAIKIPKFERHLSGGAKARARNAINQCHRRVSKMSPISGDTSTSDVARDVISVSLRRRIYARDEHTCRYCGFVQGDRPPTGDYIGAKMSIDHVVPVSQGGLTSYENCVCCCTVCNYKKNGRTPDEAGMVLSPPPGDKTVTREEERRIDIYKKPPTPLRKKKPAGVDPLFLEFWAAFPKIRKQDRADAWKAWRQAVKEAEPAVIVAAAVEYAASDVGQGQYAKGPATWLRKGCWADDREAWRDHDRAQQNGSPEYELLTNDEFQRLYRAGQFAGKPKPHATEPGRWYGTLKGGRKVECRP